MTKVTTDLFDITNRLKDINPSYQVFFNNEKQRYEIHSSNGLKPMPNAQTLEFIVPFDILDERTLTHAMRTQKENAQTLQDEMEVHNREIEQSAYIKMQEELKHLDDMMKYANQMGRNVAFTKRRQWI